LLMAEGQEFISQSHRVQGVAFHCLQDTWRQRVRVPTVSKGKLLAYLNPVPSPTPTEPADQVADAAEPRPVRDRADLFPLFALVPAEDSE